MWQIIENYLSKVDERDIKTRQEILRTGARHSLIAMLKYLDGEDSFIVKPCHTLISKLIEDRIYLRDDTKLGITAPPRCGKSRLGVAALAMVTGLNDQSNSIVGTAVNDLSKEFYLNYRTLLKNEKFTQVFPEFKGFEPKSDNLVSGGRFKITSPRSSLSGFTAGGHSRSGTVNGILLLDDINSSANPAQIIQANQFLEEQFFRRVAYQGTFYLMIGTTYSKKDSIHTTIKRHGLYSESNPLGWKRYVLPALCEDEATDLLGRKLGESIWEEHSTLSRKSLLKLRDNNPDIFQALFQGNPTDVQSELVKPAQISQFLTQEQIDVGYHLLYKLISLDTALGTEFYNDETAITTGSVYLELATSRVILLVTNQIAGRFPFQTIMNTLHKTIDKKTRSIIIENANSGIIAAQQLEQLGSIDITRFKPTKSKEAYLRSILGVLESNVYFKTGDYYEPLREQMIDFPFAKNDDRVDSLRLLVQEFINREERSLAANQPITDVYSSLILG
ncbi:MAG: hypothetical protein ACRDBG_16660 [Waterburya sp.]